MNKLVILFLLHFTFSLSIGQVIYSVNPADNSLSRINMLNCDSTILIDELAIQGGGMDISVSPDGILYIDIGGELYSIDTLSGQLTFVTDFNILIAGQTCDSEGIVYVSDFELATYDPSTGMIDYKGNFPPGMSTTGDLTFRDGELLMAANGSEIVKVDIENPENSTVLMSFSPSQPDRFLLIVGLVTVPTDCQSSVTYATGWEFWFDSLGNNQTEFFFWEVDFDNEQLNTICTDFHSVGAASPLEFIASDCELLLNFDINNSTGLPPYDYQADSLCNIFSLPIVDNDPDVYSDAGAMDSLLLVLTNLQPDGMEEYLQFSGMMIPNLTVLGNQTDSLWLINQGGNADFDAFRQALLQVDYVNVASSPTSGTRIMEGRFWSQGDTSNLATAFLPVLTGPAPVLDTFQICQGDTLTWYGNAYSSDTSFCDTFPTTTGCDSVVGLYLSVIPVVTTYDSATICSGEGYNFQGQLLDSDTTICNTFALPSGCDSTACFTLEVLSAYDSLFSEVLCEGEMYSFQGQVFTSDTSFCDTFTTVDGCDSVVCLELTFLPVQTLQTTTELCEGDLFDWQGTPISVDTFLCDTLMGMNGCDSIHCVELSFLPGYSSEEFVERCEGDTLWWQGAPLLSDTSFCDTLLAGNGCDSVLCLTLIVGNTYLFEEDAQICEGQSYFWQGMDYDRDTSLCLVYQTNEGCDSTYCLDLEVVPSPVFDLGEDTLVCASRALLIEAPDFAGHSFWWNTGATGSSIEIDSSGLYILQVTSPDGCSFTDSIQVILSTSPRVEVAVTDPGCDDPGSGSIEIVSIEGGKPPYSGQLEGNPFSGPVLTDGLIEGWYDLTLTDSSGCQLDTSFFLEEPFPLEALAPKLIELYLGEDTTITVITNKLVEEVNWVPGLGISCDTCLQTTIGPEQPTTYTIFIEDTEGCTLELSLEVLILETEHVGVPNIFTPNNDGRNDYFRPYVNNGAVEAIRQFRVFDRWGELVYDAPRLSPDNMGGWDGTFRGKEMPVDVYIYYVEVLLVNGKTEVLKGDVMLLR